MSLIQIHMSEIELGERGRAESQGVDQLTTRPPDRNQMWNHYKAKAFKR